jgi:hypothetical protein
VLWRDLGEKGKEGQENDKMALDGGWYEMKERIKAKGMKGMIKLIMFSYESFRTARALAAVLS